MEADKSSGEGYIPFFTPCRVSTYAATGNCLFFLRLLTVNISLTHLMPLRSRVVVYMAAPRPAIPPNESERERARLSA